MEGESGYYFRNHFWWLFKKRKGKQPESLRPGAMTPEQVKEKIQQIGVGKVVEILRVGYDGNIDDMPIVVEITNITEEGFSGKIVNVERKMIEEGTQTLVYARMGGGFVEFRYDDGDMKEIIESRDEAVIEESRDIASLKEILEALEIGDRVRVAYYDNQHRGTVNVEGQLLEKSPENSTLKVLIDKVKGIPLEKKFDKLFHIEKDLVIDIELI